MVRLKIQRLAVEIHGLRLLPCSVTHQTQPVQSGVVGAMDPESFLNGAGRLGQAIASSAIFAEHGINIAAVFDKDPAKIGAPIGNVTVTEYEHLPQMVHDKNIIVGVLAVPATSAQQAADDLVSAGVQIVFNYSEALLDTPADVTVHTSTPSAERLHAPAFHMT